MNPWVLLDETTVPGDGGAMKLYQRAFEFSISVGNDELMNSRMHGSEDALAELACDRVAKREQPRVLIGGLGMGFTLRAALDHLGATAEVVVAELVPAVVKWNRTHLAELANKPLDDARTTVRESDVGLVIREKPNAYDAILLDVDNGPDALTHQGNDRLYTRGGIDAARKALKPGGILGVWSAEPDASFSKRLRGAGFSIEEVTVRARKTKGRRHTIWLAEKP
ncbi:spermidine synthase [Pontiella sp.]|uniref:spermidine synthase n=1 Tax=Pontiella sp. TaxID=2837462 RepID=UPI003561D8BA